MSQAHAMSDDQVASELKKMTAFIRQEALEKAREIQLKADEEFSIEKSKLVRQETANIDTSYEQKFKTASMSQQITRSTVANKSRLRILGARQDVLDKLVEQAGEKLKERSGNKDEYQSTMKGLLLEGMYAFNEEKLQVRVRQKDGDVAKKAIEDARKEFKDNMGHDVEVDIDQENPLPEESSGGIFIIGGPQGRIDINNTLEERLKLLQLEALPQLRLTLFGANENRRFTD